MGVVLSGFGVYTLTVPPVAPVQQAPYYQERPVGASGNRFVDGLFAAKYSGIDSVNASTTSSTAPTLQLGAGTHGVITVGTSTPAVKVQYASTTAINANSMVFVQQTLSGPPGVTCNTTQATNTLVSVHDHATSTNDGFGITLGSIPTTNPPCFEYLIFDRSKSGY